MTRRLVLGLLAAMSFAVSCAAPLPSQSPQPTASPVQASPNPGLVELEGRMSDAANRLGQLVRALADASAGTPRELELVAAQLAGFATEELAWLAERDGDACYDAASAGFRGGLESLAAAAAELESLATASAPPGDEAFQGAGAALAAGSEGIEAARASAREARAACR